MAKRQNTKTIKKIDSLGVKVRPNNLYYMAAGNRVLAKSKDGSLEMYVSKRKAGGEKEMFYAAAGVRNYMTKNAKLPDEAALNNILEKAKNVGESPEVTTPTKNPFREPTQTVIVTCTDTGTRHGRREEAFETTLKKSVQKGIITPRSAAEKIKKGSNKAVDRIKALNMNMNHQYLTYTNSKKYGPGILVRITTKNGLQMSTIHGSDFNSEQEMFLAASKVRRHILRTGKVPTDTKRSILFSEASGVAPSEQIAMKEQIITKSKNKSKLTQQGKTRQRAYRANITENKMRELSMSIDTYGITYNDARKAVQIQVKGINGLHVSRSAFDNDRDMFRAALKIRNHVLAFNRKPTEEEKSKIYMNVNLPTPSEQTPSMRNDHGESWVDVTPSEQQAKSISNVSIFTKMKRWLIG